MQLSSHSCFFLYFVRFHFAFLLRARTFRILSFNFYQTEYHASLTRNFIPFVTKKKKYGKHHFRITTCNFDSYSRKHFSTLHDPKLPNFSQHLHTRKCVPENSRCTYWNAGNFQEFSRDRVKGSLIKGVCFVVSSYLHALGEGSEEERSGGAVTDEREKVELKIESSLEIRTRWLCAKNDLSRIDETPRQRMVLANEFSSSKSKKSKKFWTMIIFGHTYTRTVATT